MFKLKDEKVCDCICHKSGFTVRHHNPCCGLSNKNYINEDDTLNEEEYYIAMEESKKEAVIKAESEKKVCSCTCHQDGWTSMHFMACCNFTYDKYINEDGTFDKKRYQALVDNLKEVEK